MKPRHSFRLKALEEGGPLPESRRNTSETGFSFKHYTTVRTIKLTICNVVIKDYLYSASIDVFRAQRKINKSIKNEKRMFKQLIIK